MQNLVMPVPPPDMDSFAPKICLCGKETKKSHDFWYCSPECARLDSLRSLYVPESHYRNGVRQAYVRAGVPELYPRRMVSTSHLPPANPPPPFSPPNPPLQRNVTLGRRERDRHIGRFPTLSQVTGKVLTNKAEAGEPLVAARQDRPRWEGFPNAASRAPRAQSPQDHAFDQISLDFIPLLEPQHAPSRSLRRVPQSSDGLKDNIRKSVTALLSIGRSRKGKDAETPERVFGHAVNTIVPPVRKESLPSHRQKEPGPSANPAERSKALRRSRSFAGWNATPRAGPSNEHDTIMHIIEEMRQEAAGGSFDPRALFDLEDPY